MTKSVLTSRPELVTSRLSLKRRWLNKLESGTQNAKVEIKKKKTQQKISSGPKRRLLKKRKRAFIGICSNNYHTIFVSTSTCVLRVRVPGCEWVCAFANYTSASVCVAKIEFNIRTRHPHKTYGKCSSAKMCSIKLNEVIAVTQQDLHDLLEIFEKKSFEAVAFEEGTAVSCQFAPSSLWHTFI